MNPKCKSCGERLVFLGDGKKDKEWTYYYCRSSDTFCKKAKRVQSFHDLNFKSFTKFEVVSIAEGDVLCKHVEKLTTSKLSDLIKLREFKEDIKTP